jgi:DNA adenine methylase Dam
MINPPFNYTGSKFKYLTQLLPHLDYSKKYFVDLFAGGGSVYTNVIDRYKKIWVNDILKDMVDIHRLLLEHGHDFVKEVKSFCVDKNDKNSFHELRDRYNSEHLPAQLFALILCCTNNMIRFNKKFEFNQTFGKRTFNKKTQEKIDIFLNHLSLYKDKIFFSSRDFGMVVLNDVESSMVYVDPPYTGDSNNDAGYNCFWNKKDEMRLFSYLMFLHQNKASFCLSNVFDENGCNAPIVELLLNQGFNMVKLKGDYSKVSRNKNKKQKQEIIIKNY